MSVVIPWTVWRGDDVLEFLDAQPCREIRLRSALACSALSPDDVAANDRDLLLAALDEMATELREAREKAEEAESDALDELREERDEAIEEQEKAQLEINRLTYALGKLEDEHRALRKDLEVEGFRVRALEASARERDRPPLEGPDSLTEEDCVRATKYLRKVKPRGKKT